MNPPDGLLNDIPALEAVDTTNPLPEFVERVGLDVEPPPVIITVLVATLPDDMLVVCGTYPDADESVELLIVRLFKVKS